MTKFVMIHTDAFFRIESGKILGYKSSAISKEDIKEGKYKPGCLVYWTNMEEISDAITQMPKEGETSQFMALSINISNDTCTIKGQEDAGMFFIPKDLIFKIGEPTSLDYIMDSANPEIPFTFSPLGFYSTKEEIQNLRSKLNADTGVIQKAAETFNAETPLPLPKDEDGDTCDGCDKEGEFQRWAYNHGAFCKECIERIDNTCPSCEAEIEEIAICSVCDTRVCMECRDDNNWFYDEDLVTDSESGDICPSCADFRSGMGFLSAESKEGFSLCLCCDDSCSWLNAEGICDECEDSFNAEEFQFLNELHGQV